MNEQTGRIEAHPDGRVIVYHRSDTTTVRLDPERDIRISFAGMPIPGAPVTPPVFTGWIQLRRDDARGWEVMCWGMTPAIFACVGGNTARIEFDAASWRVSIGEPFDGHYAIRKARGQLARCAELLSLWTDGGKPVKTMLAELGQQVPVEPEPDASFRELISTYMAGDATAQGTIAAISALLGGVDP